MKRYRFLLAGLSLLITGCSASPASTAAPVSNASPVAPATSSTGPQGFLDDKLRQARRDIEAHDAAQPNLTRGCFVPPFVMIRPTDLAGFVADPPQVTPLYQMGASVTIRLVDTSNPDRWVMAARRAADLPTVYEAANVAVHEFDGARPRVRHEKGRRHA